MKVRDTFHLYVHYVSIQVKSKMQYKASFFLSAMGQFLVSFNVFLGMLFLFMRFSAVAGFTYSQVLLCFSIFLMEFSLAECVGRGFDTFSTMVRKGEFDRVMVRPRGLVLQVLGSRFELTRFGRMLQALVMFVYGVTKSGIRWNGAKVMTVAFMLAGGTAVFFGIFLTTHYVSLGSLLVYLGLVIEMVVCGQLGVFAGMTQEQLIEMYILAFALAALAYWKHRENIGRLIHGNERKTYLFKKNKPEN